MPLPELHFTWSLTSSGAATALDAPGLRTSRTLTFCAQMDNASGSGDTCVFGLEHGLSSTGTFERLGSTAYTVSSGGSVTVQLNGPLFVVRPFVIAKTASTATLILRVIGN